MKHFFTSVALITGTTIGAGTLAWPAAAAQYTCLESTLMMFLVYIFMTFTGLILAKILLVHPNSHIFSLSSRYLKPFGPLISSFCYLFIAYGSLMAYWVGLRDVIQFQSNNQIPADSIIFSLLFFILIISSKWGLRINSILFYTMILCFGIIIFYLNPFTQISLPLGELPKSFQSYRLIPILMTCFSYQMILPSIAKYHTHSPMRFYLSIITGTTIALLIYLLWSFSIGAFDSQNQYSMLAKAYAKGAIPLEGLTDNRPTFFIQLITMFSFLATLTSFIGIGMGTRDFFKDLLRHFPMPKIILTLFVLIPPLLLGLHHSDYYIKALELTGIFGDSILNCIIPLSIFLLMSIHKRPKLY